MTEVAAGAVIAGKYRLDRPLARGGMGSVWVARHLQLDAPVAIKFMAPDYASAALARQRFEREAKAAAQLRHPNVVQIHDYGVDGSTPYIVMELLDGEDLGTRLKRERRIGQHDAASVLTQAARALSRAHAAGIVHRDLKPNNLFLAASDEIETVKVLDFGIAKASHEPVDGEEFTTSGTMLGSPSYMSPEQARGHRDVDHRSDLWSLAAILFRMLTGETAFRGDAAGDVIVKICTGPLPVPSEIAPDLSPGVDRFFCRALARDPRERFQSAREMAIDFATVVGATTMWSDVTSSYRGPRPVLLEGTATGTPISGVGGAITVGTPHTPGTVGTPHTPGTGGTPHTPGPVGTVPDPPISDSGTLGKVSSVRSVPVQRGLHPSVLWSSGIGAALIVGTIVWRVLASAAGPADRGTASARPSVAEAPAPPPIATQTAADPTPAPPDSPGPGGDTPHPGASAAEPPAASATVALRGDTPHPGASATAAPTASSRPRRLRLGF